MTDIIRSLSNRPPRYDIKNDSGLTVTIEKEDSTCESLEVKLMNISVNGAKIKTKEMITAKDVFAMRIEADQPKRVIAVCGDVCWATPGTGDDWSLGCQFSPPIPDEVLHEFAEAGILERREHGRQRVSLRTSAQWELQSGTTAVRIINYSRGGFCLSSQVEGKPGERTLLQLESDVEKTIVVPGKIKWQAQSQDGFVIGCEFLDAEDYSVLCELLDPIPQVDLAGNEPRRPWFLRRSSRLFACASALLCLAITGGLILSSRMKTSASTQTVSSTVTSAAETSIKEMHEPVRDAAPIDPVEEATRTVVTESAVTEPKSAPAILVAEHANGNGGALDIERTPGRKPGVVEENRVIEARTAMTNSGSVNAKTGSTKSTTFEKPLTSDGLSMRTSANAQPTRVQTAKLATSTGKTSRTGKAGTANVGVLGAAQTHEVTSATTRGDSRDLVGGGRVKVATNEAHTTEPNRTEAVVDGAAKAAETPATIASRPVGYRTWIDDTGRYRVVARIVTVEVNIVRLRKENGRFASVPLDRLSQDDVRYVRRWLRASP